MLLFRFESSTSVIQELETFSYELQAQINQKYIIEMNIQNENSFAVYCFISNIIKFYMKSITRKGVKMPQFRNLFQNITSYEVIMYAVP